MKMWNDDSHLYFLLEMTRPMWEVPITGFYIDADNNPATGHPSSDIGMEFGITCFSSGPFQFGDIGDARDGGWSMYDYPGRLVWQYTNNRWKERYPSTFSGT